MSNPGERRHERLLAGAVALALVGGLVSGMLVVLQHIGARTQAGSGAGGAHVGANGPADRRGGSVPVLGDGSFVYRT